jgi:hypothetical protein
MLFNAMRENRRFGRFGCHPKSDFGCAAGIDSGFRHSSILTLQFSLPSLNGELSTGEVLPWATKMKTNF